MKIFKITLSVLLTVSLLLCTLSVSAASYWDVIPDMTNIYPYSVAERNGSFWGSGDFYGNTEITMDRHQYAYLNSDGSTVDTTMAKYMEFDVWSEAETFNTMNFWLSSNVWSESGRAVFRFPKLQKGWNHVCINLSEIFNYANFGTVVYDRAAIKSFFLEGTPLTEEDIELNFRFANWAFTTDEAFIPEMDNIYPYSVFEKKGLVSHWQQALGEEMDWHDYFDINGGAAIDASNAKYLEFDIVANVPHTSFGFWLSTASNDVPTRKYFNVGNLKAGKNHIVVNLGTSSNTYQTDFEQLDLSIVKSIILYSFVPTTDYDYKFCNFAFTTDVNPNPESPNTVPKAEYESNDIVAIRTVDLKGEKNNTSDERFFDYQTYFEGFDAMMKNPLDITKAKYIEFDYYSDTADTFNMSLGSLHAANGFQFYDNRSKQKRISVNAGWNHIVLSTDGEYRQIDTATLKTYNPEKVTGFILHSVSASYIRLTNVAITFSSFIDDPVLNYRNDFNWGAVMHAPSWGLPYRSDNIELQIKQLAEMGGTLLRVDATGDFNHLDKTVKLCNAYGIKVMLVVYIIGRTYDPTVSVDLDAIRKHFRIYATRYDGKHGCGKADYIQIDNEMDVTLMGWTGVETHGKEISNYDAAALAHITKQVRAASEGIAEAGTDIKRIINIGWVHYGILKYFYQEGVEWDVTGHDWYQDMFGYGGDANEFYASGQELYDLFKKPIIICETNMWMNAYYNDGVAPPDYSKSSWWDPFAKALKNYYEKDFVIGCTVYEFYDEPMYLSGEGHFGLNEVNEDGTFKAHKPMYYRAQYIFGGVDVEQKTWHEVEPEYSIFGDYDMRSLIAIKNVLLEDSGAYKADYDFVIDGTVTAEDFTKLRKQIFQSF